MATYRAVPGQPKSEAALQAGMVKEAWVPHRFVWASFAVAALMLGVICLGGKANPSSQADSSSSVFLASDSSALPKEVVEQARQAFENCSTRNDIAEAANVYAEDTLVTVNGGIDKGGPFTGRTPMQVGNFLWTLRNEVGVTNIKFTVTQVQGNTHKDTWTSDAGTGTCSATWAKDEDGNWKIIKDEITFTPSEPADEEETDAIPREVVEAGLKAFEDSFNKNDMDAAASSYTEDTWVTVNGGVAEGGPFTGKTPAEVAGFLGNLRNKMGGTNMKFTVTQVLFDTHQDTWTSDAGTGTCFATWAKDKDGNWKIKDDYITFTPKESKEDQ